VRHVPGPGDGHLHIDGPGQGEAEYNTTLPAQWEPVAAAAIAALGQRPEVDASRIGVVGVSLGGYFAVRAGALTSGLRCAASIGGCFDITPRC